MLTQQSGVRAFMKPSQLKHSSLITPPTQEKASTLQTGFRGLRHRLGLDRITITEPTVPKDPKPTTSSYHPKSSNPDPLPRPPPTHTRPEDLSLPFSSLSQSDLMELIQSTFDNCSTSSCSSQTVLSTNPSFYRIEQRIGKGCFGSVYKATQILTDLPVALKVLSKAAVRENKIEGKIRMEIEVLKRVVSESYLAQLIEVFEDEEHLYLVLEYLPNGDLTLSSRADRCCRRKR